MVHLGAPVLFTAVFGLFDALLGIGFRSFSVAPVMIPYLADTVSATNLVQAQGLAEQVCAAKHNQQVRQLLLRERL